VAGIAQGDFANLQVVVDANANGTIDAGETTTVGGRRCRQRGRHDDHLLDAFPP